MSNENAGEFAPITAADIEHARTMTTPPDGRIFVVREEGDDELSVCVVDDETGETSCTKVTSERAEAILGMISLALRTL